MGRYLGIDYGQKRIGLAVSDEAGRIAFPLCVLRNAGGQRVIQDLRRIVTERMVNKIVVGLPLNMDGSRGVAAEGVERFVKLLKEHFSLTVKIWDERLSTKIAERAMIAGGLSRARRRQSIDEATAQIILQSYLDAQG